MELNFGQVESLLGTMHDIGWEHSPAFKGRLQHLQRLKFPSGVNTGRGKKAIYGWRQIAELALCFNLLEVGISPDVAVSVIREHSREIVSCLKKLPSQCASTNRFSKCISMGKFPSKNSFFLKIYPFALSHLKSDSGEAPIVEILTLIEIADGFEADMPLSSAFVILDLGGLISLLGNQLAGQLEMPDAVIAMSYIEWASR